MEEIKINKTKSEPNMSEMKVKGKNYTYYDYRPKGGRLIIKDSKDGIIYYARVYYDERDKNGNYPSKDIPTEPNIFLKDTRNKKTELKKFLDSTIELFKKEQAELAVAKKLRAETAINPAIGLENLTVVDFFYKFLADFKSKLDYFTILGYQGYVKSFEEFLIKKGFEGLLIKHLTAYHIDQYNVYLKNEKGLKATTLKRHADVLRPAIKQAKKWKILKENIWEDINLDIYTNNVNENFDRISFTDADLQTFLKLTKDHRLKYIFRLAFLLALRRSELLGLRWSQIDLEKGTLLLKGSVQRHKEEFIIRLDRNKWGSGNALYNDITDIKPILLKIKEQIEKNKKEFGNCYHTEHEDFVCVDELGILFNPGYITSQAQKIAELMGVKKHPNDKINNLMRHMAATILYDKTKDIAEVSKFLRHTDIRTTQEYLHIKDPIVGSVSTLASSTDISEITA